MVKYVFLFIIYISSLFVIYTHISITNGSKILSYLEANELACHNLMDTAKDTRLLDQRECIVEYLKQQ